MPRRSTLLAGAVVLALLVGPAGAAAGPDATAGAPRAAQSDAAAQAVEDRLPSGPGTFTAAPGQRPGRRAVTDILTSVRSHRDLDAWLGGIGEAITTTSGGDVVTASAADEDEASPSSGGSITDTESAGDLDGDGLGDVVMYHWDVQTSQAVLEARRGDTGALLWYRAADADGGLAWPLHRDLTGDGSADLLLYDLEILSAGWDRCGADDDDCWDQWEATFRWSVGLVSGADGSAVWTRTLDGWITESYQASGTFTAAVGSDEWGYRVEGDNLDVVPFTGDLDGDGLDEVILNAIDAVAHDSGSDTYLWVPPALDAGRREGEGSLEAVTRATVIAADGSDVYDTEGAGAQISLLWPVPQPDGSADLVWEHARYPAYRYDCVYASTPVDGAELCPVDEGDDAFEIVLLDGQTFDEQWSTTVAGRGEAWSLDGDLDDDGRTDIGAWFIGGESGDDRALVLSGATGNPLWDDDILIRDVLTVGMLNSAPGDDVLAVDYTEDDSDDGYTLTIYLQRRDGVTGELLGQTEHTYEDRETEDGEVWELPYITSASDGSGDGALDVTVGKISLVFSEVGNGFRVEYGPSAAVAESGATGAELHGFSRDHFGLLSMADDFDGDGLTEVVEEDFSDAGGQRTAVFTPLRLTDATPLWTDRATGDYAFHLWGADADGAGGGEVYRHVDSTDAQQRVSTTVTSLDGRSGAGRWSVVSRP